MPTRIVRLNIPDAWHAELAVLKAQLAGVGLSLPPGSRLLAFAAAVEGLAGGEMSARDLRDPRLHALLEGARDFGELHMAATRLLPSEDSALITRFRRALGGSPLPVNQNRAARTTQYELYLAAVLSTTGYPVRFAEPDLILAHSGMQLAIAAKRIETQRQFRRRLKEGVAQIERSGHRGIVAVSFDYLNPERYPGVVASSPEHLEGRAGEIVRQIVDPLREATLQVTVGRPVVALIATIALPAIVPAQNRIGRLAGFLLRGIEINASREELRILESLPPMLQLPDA